MRKENIMSLFKIAIDPGYGYLKGINQNGDVIRLPSLVGSAHDRSLSNLLGEETGNELNQLHIKYEDNDLSEEFFVGELAKESKNATYNFDQNKINHLSTRVLIATGVALLAPNYAEKLWIGAGLPLEFYNAQKDDFKARLQNFRASITLLDKKIKRDIQFEKVTISAQGATSVYDGLLHPNGKPRYPDIMRKGSLIASINWGTRTVDVVVFEAAERFKIKPELSFTIDDAGSMEIRRMVQRAFNQKTGGAISLVEAERIINNEGQIYYNREDYDFTEQINSAKHSVANLVINSLISRWGNQASFIRAIFLSGGTVLDLKGALDLSKLPAHALVSDDPQFSDARGMLHLMKAEEVALRQVQEPNLMNVKLS